VNVKANIKALFSCKIINLIQEYNHTKRNEMQKPSI